MGPPENALSVCTYGSVERAITSMSTVADEVESSTTTSGWTTSCNRDIWLDHLIYHLIRNFNSNMCRICLDRWVMNILSMNNFNWSHCSVSGATRCAKVSLPSQPFSMWIGWNHSSNPYLERFNLNNLSMVCRFIYNASSIVSFVPLHSTKKNTKKMLLLKILNFF